MGGRHRARQKGGAKLAAAALIVVAAAGAAYGFRAEIRKLIRKEPAVVATPLPAPSGTPTPATTTAAPEPSPTRGRLVVHGTGDVNLDPDYIPAFRTHGYAHAWSGLGGLFERDHLTIVNLECAASKLGSAIPKDFTFRCDPEALPAAKRAGVEVANLGNNHSGDFGKDALLDSRRNLRRAGIEPVGAGKDERQATRPALFDLEGWRVAVLGFGGIVPEPGWIAGPNHPGMADGDDIAKMTDAVRRAKRQADVVFVTIHWGVELDTEPRPDDIERAHAMIEAGADAIFGHHAHRLQPMAVYRDRPIFWGLGNFVWPATSEAGATTAVARVVVAPEGRIRGKLLPARIESHGHPVLVR